MIKTVILLSVVFLSLGTISSKGDSELTFKTMQQMNNKDKNATPMPEMPQIERRPGWQALKIPCDSVEYVNRLMEEYEEKKLFDASALILLIPPGRPPQFAQPVSDVSVSFFLNQSNGNWTFSLTQGEYTCIITNGGDFIAGGR